MDDTKPLPKEADDDFEPRGYQDELDTDETIVDQATLDETDDPVETFGVPEEEFKDELDGLAVDENSDDDIRESIEDADEEDDNSASAGV
jgi:hypothetical protein